MSYCVFCFLFFKQKTAYEMRISDWSSDVCSSDLLEAGYTPDTGVTDEPVTINGWSPRNSNGRFSGDIDVRTAFAYSVNTVAAKLGVEVGFPTDRKSVV